VLPAQESIEASAVADNRNCQCEFGVLGTVKKGSPAKMLKREHQQNTCLSSYTSHQQCRQAWDETTAKTAAALLKYINNTIQLQYVFSSLLSRLSYN